MAPGFILKRTNFMLALLIIVVTIALLTLTVYGLHKYQTMEVEFSADRILPLPPLDKDLKSLRKPRSRNPDVKAPPRRQRIDLKAARELDMPYLELGYAYLRLIHKQDIKLMHFLWGRPRKHQTPRQLHRDWWRNTIAELP